MEESTQNESTAQASFDQRVEYWCLRLLVGAMGVLPRLLARAAGVALGWVVYVLLGRLRRVGRRNLQMAFPEKSDTERENILRGMYRGTQNSNYLFHRSPFLVANHVGPK